MAYSKKKRSRSSSRQRQTPAVPINVAAHGNDIHKLPLFLLGFIILSNIFLRFYQLEERLGFAWDQIENAWVMKNILIDGRLPVVGMVAKANSGFFMGPGYYYLLFPFYWLFHLDPIAGAYFAGVMSVFTLVVLIIGVQKLFERSLLTVLVGFIYTFSSLVITFDRIPWPVVLLPLASFIVFYCLWKILNGKPVYFFLLATVMGLSFHLHFTAIFFPIITAFCLPFVPDKAKAFRLGLLSIPFFLVWFLPMVLADRQSGASNSSHFLSYIDTYYHGFHLRRVMQLIREPFQDVQVILFFPQLDILKFLLLPAVAVISFFTLPRRRAAIFSYISSLFFLVPLLVMSTYKGELSNYYYSLTRPIAALLIGFVLYHLSKVHIAVRLILICCLVYWAYVNVLTYDKSRNTTLPKFREQALESLRVHRPVHFAPGDPVSYLYFYYQYRQTGTWPE